MLQEGFDITVGGRVGKGRHAAAAGFDEGAEIGVVDEGGRATGGGLVESGYRRCPSSRERRRC